MNNISKEINISLSKSSLEKPLLNTFGFLLYSLLVNSLRNSLNISLRNPLSDSLLESLLNCNTYEKYI
jgi:hypothetical protein